MFSSLNTKILYILPRPYVVVILVINLNYESIESMAFSANSDDHTIFKGIRFKKCSYRHLHPAALASTQTKLEGTTLNVLADNLIIRFIKQVDRIFITSHMNILC